MAVGSCIAKAFIRAGLQCQAAAVTGQQFILKTEYRCIDHWLWVVGQLVLSHVLALTLQKTATLPARCFSAVISVAISIQFSH